MDISGLCQIAVLSLATAAISVTISKARVFASARQWVAERNKWLGELLSCSYCTSHWVAIAFVAIYCPVIIAQGNIVDLIVAVFTVVAMAAVVSGVIIKLNPFQNGEADGNIGEEVKKLREALQVARSIIVDQKAAIEALKKQ